MGKLKFRIIGCGTIAARFAKALEKISRGGALCCGGQRVEQGGCFQ